MKKLLLGICYLLISQLANSQYVSGKVTDASDSLPIASATVELSNGGSTMTDQSGYFIFRKVTGDNLLLTVSSIGYRTLKVRVSAGQASLNIRLEKLDLLMQPVEVTAIRASDQSPFSKTNLSGKEIASSNLGQDLPFLLNQSPSVVVNSDAGNGVGYTGIRIRGTDATRINVTLNGIPYNDAESQGTFFVDLPDISSSVGSLQVQRGVGTSSNGSGAFGASINLSTNEVRTDSYGEINNSYGSFNTWKSTVKAGSGLIDDHFTIDARLSRLSSDGYIDRASSDLKSFYLSGAYLSGKTSIRLNVFSGKEKTYQAWYGVSEADLATNRTINYAGMDKPGNPYDNETDNYTQSHYQLFINHEFSPALQFNTAFFLTPGKGYYEQYKAGQAFADYGLPNFITGQDTVYETDLVRQLWLDNHYYGQIFSLQYKAGPDKFTFGGSWTRYDGKHYGKIIWADAGIPKDYEWYYHEAYKTDVNLYGKYEHRWAGGLSVFGDLQYKRVLYNIDGFRDNPGVRIHNLYNFFNPKLGFTYIRNRYLWYLSYSLAQKEPNRDDFEAGNQQQPVAEKLHDVELGVEYKSNTVSWGITGYYMNYRNQLVLTGKINDVGAYTRTNIPSSYRLGIEWQTKVKIYSWLQASANLAIANNKIKNFTEYYDDYDNGGQKSIKHGTTEIALSPSVTGAAALLFAPIDRMEISLLSKYVSRQYLDNTSDAGRSLDPYFVEDIILSYHLKKFIFSDSRLVLQINNLFNLKYEPNGYTYSYQYGGSLVTENYYFPMAGTNWMLGLNINL